MCVCVCVLEQHEQHTRVRDIYVTSYIRSYMSSYVPDNAPFWRQEKMQMDPRLLARKSQLPTSTAANVHSTLPPFLPLRPPLSELRYFWDVGSSPVGV